jgi:hypothetical protein
MTLLPYINEVEPTVCLGQSLQRKLRGRMKYLDFEQRGYLDAQKKQIVYMGFNQQVTG